MSVQLFCLPYAGGSASFYYQLSRYLNSEIEVIPIEMPGHGSRIDEPFAKSMQELAEDAVRQILESRKSDTAYAVLGYSLGAHVCCEVAMLLQERTAQQPVHLFFCANTAPHIKDGDTSAYQKNDEEFLAFMEKYGGIPEELKKEPELLEFFLPIMRADMAIEAEYLFQPKEMPPFHCPCSVIFSRQDNQKCNIQEWRDYTDKKCSFFEFGGNHFFILNHFQDVAEIIHHTLIF